MRGKLTSILMLLGSYLIAFLVVNTIHFQLFTVRVVLYDALLDGLIAGTVVIAIIFRLPPGSLTATREEIGLSLVVGMLLVTLYSISFPTIIDRSLSVYILEKLAQRGGSIRKAAFEEILIKEFFPEYQLVDIRLTEQLNSGTVTIENGCVRLTSWGAKLAAFTRFYRETLLPKHREIMGRFSDDLTHPYRNSSVVVPYRCEQE
jgi:hypothetical protein